MLMLLGEIKALFRAWGCGPDGERIAILEYWIWDGSGFVKLESPDGEAVVSRMRDQRDREPPTN